MIEQLAAQKAPRSKKAGVLERRRDLFMEAMMQANEDLKEGRIGVDAWLRTLTDELKGLHISAYAAGMAGDWSRMNYRDWGRVGQILRTQYSFARGWANELAVKLDQVSLAQLNARAKMYAAAATQTFERAMVAEVGIDPSVLPAFPGDGTTLCRANDRCRWSIRIISKARGDYNASWKLGAAEHCRTCRQRARAWRNLKIRGGRMVSDVEPINN